MPKKQTSPSGLKRCILVLCAVFLFMVALQLIRYSLQQASLYSFDVDSIRAFLNSWPHGYAIGWIGNTVVLSGSPVAALGLGLYASGFQNDTTSLAALIFGSRSGPDLLMFVIGFATLLKGRNIPQSFTIGILEFFTTLSMAATSLLMYLLFFQHKTWGVALTQHFSTYTGYSSLTELVISPLAKSIQSLAGPWLGLAAGLVILGVAMFTFDKFFAFVSLDATEKDPSHHTILTRWWHRMRFQWKMKHSGRITRWMHDYLKFSPLAFLLGALVTGVTLSVAISVALIIPFYAYGLMNERSAIAYIVAANITTFVDTFAVAILTQHAEITATVIGIIAATAITGGIFLLLFRYYARLIKYFAAAIASRPWAILAFIIVAILFPFPLLFS